jgi:pyridoxal phosphate enzyme (YggS family)
MRKYIDVFSTIKTNYEIVQERIYRAAIRSGRSPIDVKLVVVTKTHPVEIVHAVIDVGAKNLGENYLEEAREKIESLKDYSQCAWHMIGHVQSRKASSVVKYFNILHSLDSVKLAQRLNNQAKELNRKLPVFLEINVSGEETKSGWRAVEEKDWEKLLPDIELLNYLTNLQVIGLMTMPPIDHNPEKIRQYFQKLGRLQKFLQKHSQPLEWKELSMGMSSDYEIAIEEGSTWVRIGQAILGSRSP